MRATIGITSGQSPLRIDATGMPGSGLIGMTLCPGKKQAMALSGAWDRDLDLDLEAIRAFGATALVTLMEGWELESVQVPAPLLKYRAGQVGLEWHFLPIRDGEVPDAGFESAWAYAGLRLRRHLRAGRNVVLHCRGGLGRTGTVAARLLIELGTEPVTAVKQVRAARPGAIENPHQERYARSCSPVPTQEQKISLQERRLACLLGGAVGDAFGYAVEFRRLDAIKRQFGPEGLREPLRQAGRLLVSDDTQMTLFTLEGLLNAYRGGVAPSIEDYVESLRLAYLDWLVTQGGTPPDHKPVGALYLERALNHPRAPGNTCLTALQGGGLGTPTHSVNDSKGCGGVMRVAPIGLYPGALDPGQAFELGLRAAAITHTHPTGYLAAGVMAATIRCLLDGRKLVDAVTCATGLLSGHDRRGETERAVSGALELAASGMAPEAAVKRLGQGWVAEEALAIGLYAALRGRNFPEVFAIAANHDGDSDSTASIAGQLYGTWQGLDTLPHDWARDLDVFDVILDICSATTAVDSEWRTTPVLATNDNGHIDEQV